ncbi:MAG: glycosyltransferase family 2 protein [Eubacteriales bacterium]|nr:glycosyltransferase family 2 protein [Eubacteriales bacterium]
MYSVIVPVYEAKGTLKRCADSWLAQTEKDLELILVDDGSTDGSGALCDAIAAGDPRVQAIHQANAGVSAARNAGIRRARGEWILFTDSDDYVAEDYLERMARFQKETDSDLVLCGFHHLYEGADILKIPEPGGAWELGAFRDVFLALYQRSYLNMPWNKLYLREKAGLFDTSLSLGEDLLFNLDYLGRCRRVAVLAEPLCFYLQEESRRTLSSEKRRDRMELAARVCGETEAFFERTWGTPCTGGEIFTRYMNEALDECEKLPADRELSLSEKLAAIRSYARDPRIRERGGEAVLTQPDYRIIGYFLRKDMPRTVYALCAVRRIMVEALHRMRRKRK